MRSAVIKLLALDIDDTLTHASGNVSEEALKAVAQAQQKGIQVVLVSARSPQGIEQIAGLLSKAVHRISYVGAVIQDKKKVELQRLRLDYSIANDIARFADNQAISLTINLEDVEYHTQGHKRVSATPQVSVHSAVELISVEKTPVLIGIVGHHASSLLRMYCKERHSKNVHVISHVKSTGEYVSTLIVHKEAQKGRALLKLCEYLAIDASEVLAIGDSHSDITMFKIAGLSVAVKNASQAVQASATRVAPLPDGFGVAWAVQNFI
jgi:Cof subfamily protein (haloacid dehalogenase superfamily)